MKPASLANALAAASALLVAFAPVRSAHAAEGAAIVEAVADAAARPAEPTPLRPGEFVWQPERSGAGEVEIVVSVPAQRAYVYRGGILIGTSTISTGRAGHPTPIGKFDILQKNHRHVSNLYNNAPMPFMQRLTWDGIALHAGEIPGRPASHGCIRLPLEFARLLFGVTRIGASVHVVDTSPAPVEALALARGDLVHTGMGGPLEEVQTGTD
jgi:lipoprotein-anchoring transpeptidase ErfK/SrfK